MFASEEMFLNEMKIVLLRVSLYAVVKYTAAITCTKIFEAKISKLLGDLEDVSLVTDSG